ncbi:MAG: methylated-DNA--[protein]-cysteine S-methyltransferase [Pseudomonadota bacterium]
MNTPSATHDGDVIAALVARVCRLIEASEQMPDLSSLAQASAMSPHQLHRRFKKVTGLTPKAYAVECRAAKVRAELSRGATVMDAVFDAGYNTASRFYEESRTRLGMSPSAYRDGGRGCTIRFAIARTSLGELAVAATSIGVCSIQLGVDADMLLQDLQDRFPSATIIGGDAAFDAMVAQVCAYIESPSQASAPALPLDVRGTVFQHKVWAALQRIPIGETRTYAEIANAIGAPTAHRAVAQACANNPVAISVPCHRVIRSDGKLSGYRWGVDTKRKLLHREGALPQVSPGRKAIR